jgi:hypothetical protein
MIARPEMENLGITENWLGAHLKAVEDRMPGAFPGALPTQQHLFESTYTNLGAMAGIVPDLFRYASFDDNPYAEVEVDFEDGSKLAAKSYSYYAFMIPWMMNGDKNSCTFNAAISRAVSALLPIKSPNKERLDGAGFDSSLGEATMRRIEDKWKMLGVEGRAEPALASLRKVYTVERADINSYHDVYFGRRWEAKGPHESNLQATLQKASFPANVHEHLVLEYEQVHPRESERNDDSGLRSWQIVQRSCVRELCSRHESTWPRGSDCNCAFTAVRYSVAQDRLCLLAAVS